MLRVTKDKRDEIDVIVDKFAEFHRCCAEDSRYCTSRTKPAKRSLSGLSEIAEVSESPGREVIVDLLLSDHSKQRKAQASTHIRRSASLSGYQSSITSSSRHGSRSSFVSAATTRPMSNLGSQTYNHTDHDSPLSEIGSTLAEDNAEAASNPGAFESLHQAQFSDHQRAASFSGGTIRASGLRQEAQPPLSERLQHDIAFSSDGNANAIVLLGTLKDPNTSDIAKESAKPDDVGNGTTVMSKFLKNPASESEAIALQQSTSELQPVQNSGVRRKSSFSRRWNSIMTRLSCF
jgi:hypothetical protein